MDAGERLYVVLVSENLEGRGSEIEVELFD